MRQIAIGKIKNTMWYRYLVDMKMYHEIPKFEEKTDREVLEILVSAEIFSHDQNTHAGYRF